MIPLPSVAGIVGDDENYRQLIYEALNRAAILGLTEEDFVRLIAAVLAGNVTIGGKLAIGGGTRDDRYAVTIDGIGLNLGGLRILPTPGSVGFSQSSYGDFYIDAESVVGGRLAVKENGNVGIGVPSPGAKLDLKGGIRLEGATSGYVGLSPAAAAGSTTFTLPAADGNAGDALVTNGAGILAFSRILPAGVYIPYGGTSAPAGWLMCDGATYSEAAYPALFAAIGHTYGGDPGGGNFRVPDMRQRFPLGKADSGTGSTLGGTGGSIDHAHSLSAHTHNVDIAPFNSEASASYWQATGGTAINVSQDGHVHSINPPTTATGPPGDDFTNTNNPPFLTANFIVKT